MVKRFIGAFGASVLLLLAVAVQASPPALTDAQVRNFIASMLEIQSLGDKYPELGDDLTDLDLANPMQSVVKSMRGQQAHREFAAVTKKHGFASPEQWGGVGDRVFAAYMALSLEREAPDMQAQLEQALREIDNDPNLPAEQRAQLKQMMGGGMQLVKSLGNAPAADIEVVRPHLAELQRVLEQ